MLPLRFVPYHLVDGQPNIVIDGSANPSTTLTLSHWPSSPTPPDLLDDLSAQIAFKALDVPGIFDGVDIVTNNHFDQDGLCSAFALIEPERALARRGLVIDVARAGDFGTFESRDAARLAFVIAAYEDPATSPLAADVFVGSYPQQCGRLYEEVLPRLTELLDHPERSRSLWAEEDAHLEHSLIAIRDGVVEIDEHPDLDLAIVTVPESWAELTNHRFTQSRLDAVHPMAVNQSTQQLRVATIRGAKYRLECRYETWVMYVSRPVAPRPDLRILAERLAEIDLAPGTWAADPPGSLTPVLRRDPEDSSLSPEQFLAVTRNFLGDAGPAWDPYAPK